MSNWFECKVKYDKIMENGLPKSVSETYLVDALSFTEAEARIIEEMKSYISGEFTVANIKRVKLADMFFDETGDKWYKAKLNYITLDEKSGAEKKTAAFMLVQAKDFATSLATITAEMGTTMIDYEVASITETAIMDVFRYDVEKGQA
ncbi:MAG: DUF4494 domain-containing protein [Muribaculaceae bacterium]|nr:DUF4494 domain-containing protein [Muribaculaceae bacterium]